MTSLAADLASLLEQVDRPGDFFASGRVELLAPALEVAGVGPVALPLLPFQAEQLIRAAEAAPFGRGADTITDPAVRRCRQVGPDRVRLGGRHWAKTMDAILERVAAGLGVDGPITAEFHKLLLYQPGGHFVGHRDTEKLPGMFATLVVVLPSRFQGGDLLVRHKGREVRLDLGCDDPAEAAFAAFYADCVHEVLPVTEGYRLTLTYNLVRPGQRPAEPPDYAAEQDRIAALLRRWRDGTASGDDGAPEKLVLPLEHAYTPAELGFEALKGGDAAVAGVLAAAARQAGCDLHLALLTVEESGAAEIADDTRSRRARWLDDVEFEAGEVFDRTTTLSEWRTPDGTAPNMGEIPVFDEELSPPAACDDLTPDEEHFREATGNEGASFERSYCRAALVLWPAGRLFAVLGQAGLRVTLPYLDGLVRRWVDGGRDRRAALWQDADDLAGHMLAKWPRQPWRTHGDHAATDESRMLGLIAVLDDTPLIERFLAEITAAGAHAKDDNEAVIAALGRLPTGRRAALVNCIIAGTAVASFGAAADLLAWAALAWPARGRRSLAGAAARLLDAMPGDAVHPAPRPTRQDSPAEVDAAAVVALLTGLGTVDPALAERAVNQILASPATYGPDAVMVPAARALANAELSASVPAIERLLAACLAHLRARIAEPLDPPKDWRRDSKLPCRCSRCAHLARFLAAPGQVRWIFKAAEVDRSHVEGTIKQARCDVDTSTDRRGRPYSLVCTKNQASYERRARQRKRDLDDVARLKG